ncbi:hypothetical protein QYE76_004532 [Lolium multiflorum]|uniref:Uncharacterized protein n=1 Tax=Lolium multiflorum TaxID=4521 RepID=A0AAD8RSQ5_LOLMU|nr:hypothetical protein QYE76_004532 [Lolium multiflorum]
MQPDAIENHTISALPNDPEHQKYQRVSNEGSKSLFQELQRQLSSRFDEASQVLKNAPHMLLDAIVDSTFKFNDQALLPSESNFAPVDEIGESIEILQIEGEIPTDFPEGVYIRNGSNPLFGALHSTVSVFGESNEIWVEGEGMLHALYFTKNYSESWSVSYVNRYVESPTLKIERDRKKPCFLPAAQGDSAAVIAAYILNYLRFGKVNKSISNTNVFEHRGRVYAITESHQPVEICIQNLETSNTWDIQEEWDRPCTSHPKALLLDHAPEAGVASSIGFVFDSGDREWTNLGYRECLRSSDAIRVGRGSERSGDVRGKLIDDEIVAYWLRRAVELGDDDGEVISPRTILKASETVFGRGLDCFWASTWAAAGLALAAAVQVLKHLNISIT